MPGKNEAFLNNVKDVICEYIEKRFKEVNESIDELREVVSKTAIKYLDGSIKTAHNNLQNFKQSDLTKETKCSDIQEQNRTSEILQLMKVIEGTNASTCQSGKLDCSETENGKANCSEKVSNKNNPDIKNLMRFQMEIQLRCV